MLRRSRVTFLLVSVAVLLMNGCGKQWGENCSSDSDCSSDYCRGYSAACGAEISKGQKCINGSQVGSGCP